MEVKVSKHLLNLRALSFYIWWQVLIYVATVKHQALSRLHIINPQITGAIVMDAMATRTEPGAWRQDVGVVFSHLVNQYITNKYNVEVIFINLMVLSCCA